MKIATVITRSLLGFVFLVFGLNMFLNFIHMPPPPEGPAREFFTALYMSHYLYAIGALQIIGGLLLWSNRTAPLGLTLVGPVVVNILLFHSLMAPAGLPLAFVVAALALFLLWNYRKNFAGLLAAPATVASTQTTTAGAAPARS